MAMEAAMHIRCGTYLLVQYKHNFLDFVPWNKFIFQYRTTYI